MADTEDKSHVYITKYALTGGVRLCRVKPKSDFSLQNDNYVCVEWPGAYYDTASFKLGRHAFWNERDARTAVYDEIGRKRTSLERQLRQLEAKRIRLAKDGLPWEK